MIEEFYGFDAAPFRLTPDPRFFYPSGTHKRALSYLMYGVQQGEGFIVVTGDVGTGKSTLIGYLLDRLDPGRIVPVQLSTSNLEAHDALRMIVAALGARTDGDSKAHMLEAIERFLAEKRHARSRVLLVIDEAQNLPPATIEELRMLTNLQAGGSPLQCFLVGQPQLRGLLARPEFEQLRQRVIASCHLEPLSPEETRDYVEHRLRTARWQGRPAFSEGVFRAIHRVSGGVPRRINMLLARLLLFGALEEREVLDEDAFETVVADLAAETVAYEPRPDDSLAAEMAVPGRASGDATGKRLEELEARVGELEGHLLEVVRTATALLLDTGRMDTNAQGGGHLA
jgi:general secretion pathway protein A